MSKFSSDDFCLCLPEAIWSVHAKYEICTHYVLWLSVKAHLPSFLCSLPPPLQKRLIYDICWRRTELWPSPVVHGNSSSACLSSICTSGLRDAAVGSSGEQLCVGKEQNSHPFSSAMAPLMTGIMDVLGAREGEKLEIREVTVCGQKTCPLNNRCKSWLPPLPTVALLPAQTKTSLHQ